MYNMRSDEFENEVANNDSHRRQASIMSMKAKIAANKKLIELADDMAEQAMQSANQEDYATMYRHAEAVYAAVDEAINSLRLVQLLCVKSSTKNTLPEFKSFKEDVESGRLSSKDEKTK